MKASLTKRVLFAGSRQTFLLTWKKKLSNLLNDSYFTTSNFTKLIKVFLLTFAWYDTSFFFVPKRNNSIVFDYVIRKNKKKLKITYIFTCRLGKDNHDKIIFHKVLPSVWRVQKLCFFFILINFCEKMKTIN